MTQNAPLERQLNPFVFPSETDTLFTLLVIAAVTVIADESILLIAYILLNFSPPNSVLAALPFVLFVLIFAVSMILYRRYPGKMISENSLEPFEDKTLAPGLDRELAEKARRAGLSFIPGIVIQRARSFKALAFGAGSSRFVRIDSALLLMLSTAPGIFWAPVLHELAHFRNKDVRRHYFAKALTWSVITLLVVPFSILLAVTFIASFFGSSSGYSELGSKLGFFLMLMLQGIAVAVCFALIRAKLLRVREYYADYRASLWGARDYLQKILAAEAKKEEEEKGREETGDTEIGFLKKIRKFHPSARERADSLGDPDFIFRLSKGLPFIASILLSLLMQGAVTIVFSALVTMISGVVGFGGSYIKTAEKTADYSMTTPVLVLMVAVKTLVMAILAGGLFYLIYLSVKPFAIQILRESILDLIRDGRRGSKRGPCSG